ncbi:YjbE family putative metal transport protein [Pedomonas mirosovicensis]|uniref:YjbE family putative metal transport protein n=1 Tax=Pedomonas mirosovicensis TaxID=2908641 RepID=UPI00216929D3|nr:YjbE family putative metal transport protein [Pedomonas mirosovicensis]MCH8684105.1 YjbE family putative metal transport protein [Pedomonas mirosovicensis]
MESLLQGVVDTAALAAFLQVVLIDITLAGDNAIVVGSLAAGLPKADQRRVIFIGILAALILRIIFALVASQLLEIIGLLLAGGILLLWVAWKMYRELHPAKPQSDENGDGIPEDGNVKPVKSFAQAAWAVALADVSMSLDNVLAVAGASHEHPWIMVFGLVLSVALMGVAAGFIARVIDRFRWIAYVGLVVIIYVALKMIWEGWHQVAPFIGA